MTDEEMDELDVLRDLSTDLVAQTAKQQARIEELEDILSGLIFDLQNVLHYAIDR